MQVTETHWTKSPTDHKTLTVCLADLSDKTLNALLEDAHEISINARRLSFMRKDAHEASKELTAELCNRK